MKPDMSISGWLSPYGKFHKCVLFEHVNKADEICCSEYLVESNCPNDDLLQRGWMRFTAGYVFIEWNRFYHLITDAQLRFINENTDISKEQKKCIAEHMEKEKGWCRFYDY